MEDCHKCGEPTENVAELDGGEQPIYVTLCEGCEE